MAMKDLFSKQAAGYARFRPTYPKPMYDFILQQVRERRMAWDCATGNGQVACDLAKYFEKVYATDPSTGQIEHATRVDNIQYSLATAEKTWFPASTFDLITVGQAIHWFNIPEFYKEAIRVAKPDAVIAVWGYSLLTIAPAIDAVISDFYVNIIGTYWDAERKLVDKRYRTIPFPFEEIAAPEFTISFQWTLAELRGYLSTWSAVQKYIGTHGINPVEELIAKIQPLWEKERQTIHFPLFLRCGRIRK